MEIFIFISFRAKAPTNGAMETHMPATGSPTNSMVKAFSNGKMAEATQEDISRTNKMVMEPSSGQMAENTLGCGKTGSGMESDFKLMKMEEPRRLNGDLA